MHCWMRYAEELRKGVGSAVWYGWKEWKDEKQRFRDYLCYTIDARHCTRRTHSIARCGRRVSHSLHRSSSGHKQKQTNKQNRQTNKLHKRTGRATEFVRGMNKQIRGVTCIATRTQGVHTAFPLEASKAYTTACAGVLKKQITHKQAL